MKIDVLKVLACIAWLGAAVTSATPADAHAITKQSGDYAACSANYDVDIRTFCEFGTSYRQTIRFMSTACNSGGGCDADFSAVYLDNLAATGRKQAWFDGSCSLYNVYALGSCDC
jgi:hypothetical protein